MDAKEKFGQACSCELHWFERVIKLVMLGENVVWHIDSIEDFVPFVNPYYEHAISNGNMLIYFRFAKKPLLADYDLRKKFAEFTSILLQRLACCLKR